MEETVDWRSLWTKQQKKHFKKFLAGKTGYLMWESHHIPQQMPQDNEISLIVSAMMDYWPQYYPTKEEMRKFMVEQSYCKYCKKYSSHSGKYCEILGSDIDVFFTEISEKYIISLENIKLLFKKGIGLESRIIRYEQISLGGPSVKPIYDKFWSRKHFDYEVEIIRDILQTHPKLSPSQLLIFVEEKLGGKEIIYGRYEGHPQSYRIFSLDLLRKYLNSSKCLQCESSGEPIELIFHAGKCPKLKQKRDLSQCYKCKELGHYKSECNAYFSYDGKVVVKHNDSRIRTKWVK